MSGDSCFRVAFTVVLAQLAWVAAPQPLMAQSGGLLTQSGLPLSIEADQGVEWRRKEQIYIARGNATARQGKTSIRADELKAHYRKSEKNKTQIWKFTATGKVDIKTEKETASGESAVYTVDTGVFVLLGRNLRLSNRSQTITATDRIEYRRKDRRAYVIGNAKVVDGEKIIRAGRFIAYLKDGKDGKVELRRVEAQGRVVITTGSEVIRADRGDYNNETRLATLTGNVKLTRGDNQLNGKKAIVNLNTGVSRMIGRVSVLLVPGNRSKSGDGSGAAVRDDSGQTQGIDAVPRPRGNVTGAQ